MLTYPENQEKFFFNYLGTWDIALQIVGTRTFIQFN